MARTSHRSPIRAAATFAGGALLAFVGTRLLPPIVAQARGAARSRAGGDPLASLLDDHRTIMFCLDAMVESADGEVFNRTQHLARLKRRLAIHAMAEEDIVYPALRDRPEMVDNTARLYEEHAEMKVLLYRLEQTPKRDEQWHLHATGLRTLIARHIRQEEDIEFPKLRALLDERMSAELASRIEREKSLLL